MRMNENTHRTVQITAEMHIPYSIEINVPIHLENEDIWELLIREGHIDGGAMTPDDNDGWGADWTWGDVHDRDFNSDADDYSDCFPNHKCDMCEQYMESGFINDYGVCIDCEEEEDDD